MIVTTAIAALQIGNFDLGAPDIANLFPSHAARK
jgi:hypothetical protein